MRTLRTIAILVALVALTTAANPQDQGFPLSCTSLSCMVAEIEMECQQDEDCLIGQFCRLRPIYRKGISYEGFSTERTCQVQFQTLDALCDHYPSLCHTQRPDPLCNLFPQYC